MRRKLLALLCCASICLVEVGCKDNQKGYEEAVENKGAETLCGGYFVVESEWKDSNYFYKIVYARDTGVKYFVMKAGYKLGITPLYNADGSLQVAEGYEVEE